MKKRILLIFSFFCCLHICYAQYRRITSGKCGRFQKHGNSYFLWKEDSGLYESSDALRSFHKVGSNYTKKEMGGISAGLVCTDKNIFLTTIYAVYSLDRKKNLWVKMKGLLFDDPNKEFLSIVSCKNKILIATSKGILQSINEGKTWSQVKNMIKGIDSVRYSKDSAFIYPDFSDKFICGMEKVGDEIYFLTGAGKFYRSKDGGNSWTLMYDIKGEMFGFDIVKVKTTLYMKASFCSLLKFEFNKLKPTVIKLNKELRSDGNKISFVNDSLYLSTNNGKVFSMNELTGLEFKESVIKGFESESGFKIIEIIDNKIIVFTNSGVYLKE
ncbi:MAG: hypothetical protein HYZ42_12135 [Bacteroidetes bacterium]|nr:hypothetical protein [Bacteroidota bacterium]